MPPEASLADREKELQAQILARKQRLQEEAVAAAARRQHEQELQAAAARVEQKKREQSRQAEAALSQKKELRRAAAIEKRRQIEAHAQSGEQRREDRLRQRALRVSTAEEVAARPRMQAAAEDTAVEDPEPEQPQDSLPQLGTLGPFIADPTPSAVNLRGVTVIGFDTLEPLDEQTFPAALGLDDAGLSQITQVWGANVVRLTFRAKTFLLGTDAFSAADMLLGLDETVAAITTAGAYVLLALEPAGDDLPPAPDGESFQVWRLLAAHYRDEPGVLYEILASSAPMGDNWPDIAARLVGAIREKHSGSLIFVGSGKGGADVSGLPLRFSTGDPVFNLVYTISVSAEQVPDPNEGQFLALAEAYPLFAPGWQDGDDRSSLHVSDLLERYGIGWGASNWNAEPRLVADVLQHDFTPTGWGLTVQRAIKLPVRPLLQAFRSAEDILPRRK